MWYTEIFHYFFCYAAAYTSWWMSPPLFVTRSTENPALSNFTNSRFIQAPRTTEHRKSGPIPFTYCRCLYLCIAHPPTPPTWSRGTTAAGLPLNGVVVKASTVNTRSLISLLPIRYLWYTVTASHSWVTFNTAGIRATYSDNRKELKNT